MRTAGCPSLGCYWSHHTQPVSSFMCVWVSGWHALVHITAPGEPFSGGYSSPQNGRSISEPALWADAPELPASAPFVMSASLVGARTHSYTTFASTTGAARAAMTCRFTYQRPEGSA